MPDASYNNPLISPHTTANTQITPQLQVLEADFDATRRALLDRGWVIALAHVRGGGELGRRWAAVRSSLTPNAFCHSR